ncbi:MAG: bis(5'-nucleosyl)-tetraphosphatase (symmetrical) YqeK [Polyangia bacterium]|jgi:predicted HD superfamily hydrolase involved in NAD metabolism|nr:bis(5'-nucleosyl)-tetraphosphatase (symmetrical) YqeK [Polyangia bacterium]
MRLPDWLSRSGPPRDIVSGDLEEQLSLALSPATFRHCLAVRDHAAALAPSFGAEPSLAALAGLLHDCAKNLSPRELLGVARLSGLELFAAERASPKVLHQRVGAVFASRRHGISQTAVLEAIACHTTGKGEMDALARCILVADYTSPDRVFDGVEGLRAVLGAGSDEAFGAVLAFKRELVYSRGLPAHPWAEAAYARYL